LCLMPLWLYRTCLIPQCHGDRCLQYLGHRVSGIEILDWCLVLVRWFLMLIIERYISCGAQILAKRHISDLRDVFERQIIVLFLIAGLERSRRRVPSNPNRVFWFIITPEVLLLVIFECHCFFNSFLIFLILVFSRTVLRRWC